MSKANLLKTAARNASFTLLTAALLLACSCSGVAEKDSAAGQRDGWDLLPEILSRIVPPTFPDRDFKVTDYGASGDGVTDCNPAFKKAIAACTKAGGGRVVVPKGIFISNGPIHLDNNVNLHVTKNATIMFGTNFDDYLPHVRVRWEGTECYNYSPLVYAYKKTNIAITGSGSLNGQAESSWAMWSGKTRPGTTSNEELRKMNHDDVPVKEIKIYAKPTMIEPFECKNVLIEGVTLNDYPFWCVHPTFCTNVTIRKLRIESHNSNNDGIDPDSSTDVLIEDCYLDQSDDCLAIKAGRDNSAWRAGKPCQNIVIRNMPSNFDGIAIGSECSGGVQNVFVYDCDYDDGNILYCKSNLDRGGFIKDIYIKDLNVGKARILRLRNNYHGYRGGNFPTEIRNINIENVHIKEGDDETISLQGVEAALVYDVFIKNVTIDKLEKGPIVHLRNAENVVLTNVKIAGKIQPTHPPMMPPEKKELEGTASIAPRRSGKWSNPSNWETGRDAARLKWSGDAANRLPDDKIDERVLIGKSRVVKDGVTVTLDSDIDGEFEVRVYERSTFVIPDGFTFKIKGPLIVDRTKSVARQLGGAFDVAKNLDIDTETGQYVITGGSIKVGNALSLNEGTFIVDDSRAKIKSITVGDEFRTGDGDGDTTTKFVAHKGGVTPIQTKDILLDAYIGEKLIVDVSAYDYAKHGDLVLFSYTGVRKGEFDGGPEKPAAQVTIIGAKADLVYDDAGKKVKLTNFRQKVFEVKALPLTSAANAAAPNLVGWWKLDGNANDSSGNKNHGALLGDPKWVAGKIGGALAFDGDDAVDLGNPNILDFGTGDWTICAWIKTTYTGRKGTIFANGGGEGGGIRYTLCLGEHKKIAPDRMTLTVDDNLNKREVKGKTIVADGQWHHVVGMRDGTTLRGYVDGVPDETETIPAGYNLSGTSQHNAYIGAIWHHEDGILLKHFMGLIDDVLIYSRALRQEEIQGMVGKDFISAREAADEAEGGVREVKAQPLPSAGAAILSVQESDGVVELKTRELNVRVLKDPWHISVFDKNGRLLTRETQGKALQYGEQRVTRVKDHKSLGRVRIVKRDPPYYHAEDEAVIVGESVQFNCETTENGREAQVYITFRSPAVFSVWMTVPEKIEWTRDVFESSPSEHFFGLGECWNAQSLDLKGLSVKMANRKGTPDQGGYVPFYLSTRGYGILVDNYLKVKFDFSDDDSVAIEAPSIADSEDGDGYFKGSSMLWYFYYGPDLLDVIDRYTEHVSRPAMPPSWSLFTTWQWRDTSDQKVVYEDAKGMRQARIPCGLIWVDRPWATGSDNMPPPFEWQPDRFPNGHQMFMDLNEMGYKTGVWVAKNLYGDMDNPALVRKLKADAQPWLRRDNCQMYKIDRGNTQRMDPYFTCQAYWETWDEIFKGDFVTLPRVVAFRGQKHVNGKWPGDNSNKYEYTSGLKANIGAMLNFAIAGFPFWGSDTGGFPDPEGNEVTVRWAEFSSMCPIFQTAGTPYQYPEKHRDIYRKYAEHYTRMFPYRWSYAKLAHEKGHPICRALALHYPDDANCYNRKFEYLFGEWILVAPVVETATEREVYLPEGKWIDWWDGTVHTGGGTITCSAPLDKLPMLVKAGAIIPMIDVQQTWFESSVDRLTLRIYPEGSSQFTIAGDDKVYPGRSEPYINLKETEIKCHQADGRIDIDISPSEASYMLEVHCGAMPSSVRLDGKELKRCTDTAALNKADSGWTFEQSAGPAVWIKVPGQAAARHAIRIMLESIE